MSRTVSVPGDNAGRPAGASGDQLAVAAPIPGRLRPWPLSLELASPRRGPERAVGCGYRSRKDLRVWADGI
jgi:hypothetical protein